MKVKCAYKNCSNEFEFRSNKQYCHRRCKTRAKDIRTQRLEKKRRPYILHKKEYCEYCGFIPLHLCQLDVDHIDGNHKNNCVENLQTLCANCHRLKTFLSKDWEINK